MLFFICERILALSLHQHEALMYVSFTFYLNISAHLYSLDICRMLALFIYLFFYYFSEILLFTNDSLSSIYISGLFLLTALQIFAQEIALFISRLVLQLFHLLPSHIC